MTEERSEQTSAATPQESINTPQPEKKKPVNLDDFEEFKKYKSAVDKRQNELAAQLEAERQAREDAQRKLEDTIADPALKSQLRTQRLESQLDFYKKQEEVARQRRLFAEKWGVPVDVLDGVSDPSEMTVAALDYLKNVAEEVKKVQSNSKKVSDLQDAAASGANDVSIVTGPPITGTATATAEQEKQLQSLKDRARKGDARARADAFVLQAQMQRTARSARSKV